MIHIGSSEWLYLKQENGRDIKLFKWLIYNSSITPESKLMCGANLSLFENTNVRNIKLGTLFYCF